MIVNSRILGDPIPAPNTLVMLTMYVSFPSGMLSFRTNRIPVTVVAVVLKVTLPVWSKKSPVDVFVTYRNAN